MQKNSRSAYLRPCWRGRRGLARSIDRAARSATSRELLATSRRSNLPWTRAFRPRPTGDRTPSWCGSTGWSLLRCTTGEIDDPGRGMNSGQRHFPSVPSSDASVRRIPQAASNAARRPEEQVPTVPGAHPSALASPPGPLRNPGHYPRPAAGSCGPPLRVGPRIVCQLEPDHFDLVGAYDHVVGAGVPDASPRLSFGFLSATSRGLSLSNVV